MKMLLSVAGLAIVLAAHPAMAQGNGGFDINAYKLFLATHQDLESAQLRSMYSAGEFLGKVSGTGAAPRYLDSIDAHYALTSFEKQLITRNGFAVTSRLPRSTMIDAFGEIYANDLPVFISTDAILEAVHFSYDRILKDLEKGIIMPGLDGVLASLHGQIAALDQKYGTDTRMKQMLRDVDVYLTVPLILLGEQVAPYFPENVTVVNGLLADIAALKPLTVPLFAATSRIVDFSQFTVRGHYAQDSLLSKYFQAMIWLGRTEIYLRAPRGTETVWPQEDIQRQTIDALLIAEALEGSGAQADLGRIDTLITFLVGQSDNVTVATLEALSQRAEVQGASDLLDTTRLQAFQALLDTAGFAFQRINSQILISNPYDPGQVRPASAFMLLGQRFVIDSYVTGNVVFDKIVYNGQKIWRALPSTLDVLFALGNDAAAQLLESELVEYKYATNLAALRYLIDSYDNEFWKSSLFNCWLEMLRTLNPPRERLQLPSFMQTAAWWQEKMNTQLASWAQLRHDNLLYAKQSYTGGIKCSYPAGYVEPVPAFFDAVKSYAEVAAGKFGSMGLTAVGSYFQALMGTADTLGAIARKELLQAPLLPAEAAFLQGMLYRSGLCGIPYEGWYAGLFYSSAPSRGNPSGVTDCVVADVHTAPTDKAGNMVGWVLHVGTGPVDLAVLSAQGPGGTSWAFIGPVLHYYERITQNFQRLTDEEWKTLYSTAPTFTPDFVNLYMADGNGQSRGSGPMLLTDVQQNSGPREPGAFALYQNFPNPFNPSTFIGFTVPSASADQRVRLEVFDLQGRLVARLFDEQLPHGSYTVRWDGLTLLRRPAASGVYFYRLSGGSFTQTMKMLLVR